MFHDRARISVQAGRGGDVVLVSDDSLRDLSAFRGKTRFRASRGQAGRGSNKHGAAGDGIELRVPAGTQVFEAGELVADVASPGARVVIARGGPGGRGNRRFPSSTRQTPRFAEVGLPGEEAVLELR